MSTNLTRQYLRHAFSQTFVFISYLMKIKFMRTQIHHIVEAKQTMWSQPNPKNAEIFLKDCYAMQRNDIIFILMNFCTQIIEYVHQL